ncbi:MAG: GIY-YIG nuclease family protein [Clostridia bacterium]|nr:GIY-YIG nuclease family protein [Clostridia bacterium]
MNKIKLNDLLRIADSNGNNVKIRFNQNDGNNDPMDLYLKNPEIVNSQWLFWRKKQRYFNVGQIAICLLNLAYDTWLLTTIKKVTKELDVLNGINYIGEELSEYRQYFGRVIVKYHKTAQTQGMFYNTVCDELEVLEVLPGIYDGDEFPGYDKVRLSFTQLQYIFERKKKSWIAALENQKAIYLITDKNNGKLYVGSATSINGMLLSRWSDYVKNGHGGNVEFKKIVDESGFEYIKQNFQYSILENYNARVDDCIVLDRESWWKDTLQSRNFGYNDN